MTHIKRILAAATSLLLVPVCGTMPVSAEEENGLVRSDISYEESVETILNPGAGYTTTPWYRLAPGEVKSVDRSGSVVLFFIYIGAYSSGANGERLQTQEGKEVYSEGTDYDLDESFFESLRGSFENCRKNGSMIALRFRYDENGYDDPEPAAFDQVLRHIQQIKDSGILEEYADILAFVESGMVGKWGEQHGGKYVTTDYKAQVLDAFIDAVPEPVPVTVRTPDTFAKWIGVSRSDLPDYEAALEGRELTDEQKHRLTHAYRVGLYNDGYMGSNSDLGTYADREKETAWLNRQCVTAYYGGEFSGNISFAQQYDTYLPENAIPEMYRTHLSYINANIFQLYKDYTFGKEYDVEGADNSAYYGQSVFQFVRDHIGYRFVLRDAQLTGSVPQGGDMEFRLKIENTGFANPIPDTKAYLLLERDGEYISCPLKTVDANKWASCTVSDISGTVSLPGGLPEGEWRVYLRLQMGDNTFDQDRLRTVHFANKDIWNVPLGANFIGKVTVTGSDSSSRTFTEKGMPAEKDVVMRTVRGHIVPDGIWSEGEWTEDMLIGENGDNKVYMTADENNIYIMGQLPDNGDGPVYNLRLTREDGESYWLYYSPNGYVYFNHGDHAGDSCKHTGRTAEFTVPLSMLGLEPGTELKQIRLFLQDSAHDWEVLGEVNSEPCTVPSDFRVFTGCTDVVLGEGDTYTAEPLVTLDGAKYQWYKDGKEIEGADTKQYTVSDAGTYSVRITAANGGERTVDMVRVHRSQGQAPEYFCGDANLDGRINVSDAVAVLQYAANRVKYPLSEQGLVNADVDGVTGITGSDAIVIQQVDAGVIKQAELPLVQ